jgi:hypothetical protein
MYKTISNEIIRSFNSKSNLLNIITDENEELTVRQWVEKYRNIVPPKDILWLLLRKEFMSEKDLRLFAVWCAREALKLIEDPDERSVEACNVAEKYANGEATKEELDAAYDAVYDAAAAYAAYAAYHVSALADSYAAYAAAYAASAAYYVSALAVSYAADVASCNADSDRDAVRTAQVDKLLTYFE